VGAVELLGELADDEGARRVGKALELTQMLVERLARARALDGRSDEERPFGRRGDGDQISRDEKFLGGESVGNPTTAFALRWNSVGTARQR